MYKVGVYMYNKFEECSNMIYSVDMLRLKTYITYNIFSELEFRFQTVWKEYLKKKYTTGRMKEFFYNYVIEVGEGQSFWFGFLHNTEKRSENNYAEYNFTIEFNPNKLKDNKIIMYLLGISGNWFIKSLDLAVDLKINILDIIVDISGRQVMKIESHGFDNRTYSFGKGDGRVKIYNKKIESKLQTLGDLSRVEVSREFDDFPIKRMKLFKFDDVFPYLYTQNYIYSFCDYKDKTLLALLYAVQNGFPIKDLTKTYKTKIKNLLEGGYKIKFDTLSATRVICSTIYFYFMKNEKVLFL